MIADEPGGKSGARDQSLGRRRTVADDGRISVAQRAVRAAPLELPQPTVQRLHHAAELRPAAVRYALRPDRLEVPHLEMLGSVGVIEPCARVRVRVCAHVRCAVRCGAVCGGVWPCVAWRGVAWRGVAWRGVQCNVCSACGVCDV